MRTVERTNSRRFPGQMLACFLALWVGAATAAQGGDAKSSPMWLVTVRPATPHLHDMAKWTAEQKTLRKLTANIFKRSTIRASSFTAVAPST